MQPTFARKFMEIYSYVAKLYPTTAIVLFCIFSYVINKQLNAVKSQVESLITNPPDSDDEAKSFLSKLQRQHVQICLSVGLLNRCFGLILLIDIPFNFIGVINTTMNFFMNGSVAKWSFKILQLATFVNHIINVILISFRADKIASQVSNGFYNKDIC